MILAVNINSTLDVVVPINKFKHGAVLRTKSINSYPGGKATNVARALAALGADVIATGFTSYNETGFMRGFLKKHRVESDFVSVSGSNRICLLITEQETNTETIINSESNFNITEKDISVFLKKIKDLSKKASFVILSGSLPLSLPKNFYQTVIKVLGKNSKILLDTSSEYLFHGIKASPYIIKQNIHELESAFKINFGADFHSSAAKNRIKNFMTELSKKYSVPTIIVTLDKNGSFMFNRGTFVYCTAVKVKKTISPVGCGDAFSAGLVYGLSKPWPVSKTMRLAACCAAANLSYLGSCFFKKKDVQLLFKGAI